VIGVLLIAELRLYREGLAELLEARDGISVVAAVSNGEEALARIEELRPDVALVDMAMIDNRHAILALGRRVPAIKIVAVGLSETEHAVLACVEAGIAAYVARDGTVDEVVSAIRRIMDGEATCPPEIVASLFRHVAVLARQRREPSPADQLTRRELQIASLITSGLSNKEIATELQIELSTVKNHVHNLFEKLRIARRTQIPAWFQSASLELRDLEPPLAERGRRTGFA
jgi:DNA-binding NarL/FixJ family response regulator